MMLLGAEIVAINAVYWGLQGAAIYFVESNNEIYRMIARDVSFKIEDCSDGDHYCIEDSTGFQLSYPKDLSSTGYWRGDYSWSVGENNYTIEWLDHEYGVSSGDVLYTISRENSQGSSAIFQVSLLCGVTYIEFFPDEIPNLYDQAIEGSAGFYLGRCESRGA